MRISSAHNKGGRNPRYKHCPKFASFDILFTSIANQKSVRYSVSISCSSSKRKQSSRMRTGVDIIFKVYIILLACGCMYELIGLKGFFIYNSRHNYLTSPLCEIHIPFTYPSHSHRPRKWRHSPYSIPI